MVGVATCGRMKDLNDLSRFFYSYFPSFTARTHPHKYNGQYTKKKGEREKGRKAKARVSEPFAEGGMSFSAVFNGGDRVPHGSCIARSGEKY